MSKRNERRCGCGRLDEGEECPRPDGSLLCDDNADHPTSALASPSLPAGEGGQDAQQRGGWQDFTRGVVARWLALRDGRWSGWWDRTTVSARAALLSEADDLLAAVARVEPPAPVRRDALEAAEQRGYERRQAEIVAALDEAGGSLLLARGRPPVDAGPAPTDAQQGEREEAAAWMEKKARDHDREAGWYEKWPYYGTPDKARAAAARYRLAAAALRLVHQGEQPPKCVLGLTLLQCEVARERGDVTCPPCAGCGWRTADQSEPARTWPESHLPEVSEAAIQHACVGLEGGADAVISVALDDDGHVDGTLRRRDAAETMLQLHGLALGDPDAPAPLRAWDAWMLACAALLAPSAWHVGKHSEHPAPPAAPHGERERALEALQESVDAALEEYREIEQALDEAGVPRAHDLIRSKKPLARIMEDSTSDIVNRVRALALERDGWREIAESNRQAYEAAVLLYPPDWDIDRELPTSPPSLTDTSAEGGSR